ncbi:MAG: mechanosensitive ion channel family protein [Myxococcales bacterium]|nr:mechanosensitive ion channel family protein [Myxococcales bacterium]
MVATGPSLWVLLWLLVRAAVIVALLWGLGRLLEIAPMPGSRRRLAQRVMPLFAVTVCLAYLLLAITELFGSQGTAMSIAAALVVAGLGAALWWPARDLLAGVFLRTGDVLRPGDEIEVQGISGRVESMGFRRMVVLGPRGEVIVPYAAVARSAIVRAPANQGAHPHLFRVRPVEGHPVMELRRIIAQQAMLCHWSSLCREPQVRVLEDGGLEVTAFALHQDYGSEIEASVRAKLAELQRERTTSVAHLSEATERRLGGGPEREGESRK